MRWTWRLHPATVRHADDHGCVRTVGVEEELLVVDGNGRPVPLGPDALDVASRRGEGENPEEHDRAEREGSQAGDEKTAAHLMPELKAQQLELGTAVCRTLSEVDGQLRFWRARAQSAAAAAGAHVAALATSPIAVRPIWLPVLTALTANSPFWQGEDTGYASFRSQAWHRWPSAGPNEVFADAGEYHRLIDQVLATGTVLDTGMVYFDARLSASWPTVEVRTADVALRVEDAVTLAGVVRGLVETAARDARAGNPPPAVPAAVLRVAAWRSGRSGLSGDLVHPLTGRPRSAADVLGALLDHIRPALAHAGDEQRVADGLGALLRRGTGADLQRRVHEETADLTAVVRAAVTLTGGRPEGTDRAVTVATG
jgi:carboxylate-amine ligase